MCKWFLTKISATKWFPNNNQPFPIRLSNFIPVNFSALFVSEGDKHLKQLLLGKTDTSRQDKATIKEV